METEVRTLKQELSRTREALKLATKRCRDLVRELDSRTVGHESERCLRDQQLSRILRALLVLESRLKQEQKSIRQLLCEKDNVIRIQQLEIAKLRRYTKNYIKCKREQNNGNGESIDSSSLSSSNLNDVTCFEKLTLNNRMEDNEDGGPEETNNELGNEIESLKREIIDKLNTKNLRKDEEEDEEEITTPREIQNGRQGREKVSNCCVRKTNSFAGSDISKESCASSSENTDAGSFLTTTTDESSPSLLSTEGFCEGDSTDCSPGSTLEKSISKSFGIGISRRIDDLDQKNAATTTTTNENAIIKKTLIVTNDFRNRQGEEEEEEVDEEEEEAEDRKRRYGVVRAEPLQIFFNDDNDDKDAEEKTKVTIPRTDSKDDGMDCNFASDDENLQDIHEPIYVNACNENNARNLKKTRKKMEAITTVKNVREYHFDNNNGPSKLEQDETNVEETSGNWYSDPDEDRISDDVFRHSTYRPNSNHNSVLECVNQILLRDMEEEESTILTAPRRFKHRGRIVRFQPARLSDIESVGSEMERRNSEDCPNDSGAINDTEIGNFEATGSEDEFGMRMEENGEARTEVGKMETETNEENEESVAAIPIIVIEPKESIETIEQARNVSSSCLEIVDPKPRSMIRSASPTLRMERIEEKTCLQMSSKGLTIAKNLDYEDIESLPDIVLPRPKTPPALPPKPTHFRNTLILKKIPSPSFLIDETRGKYPQRKIDMDNRGGIASCLSTPKKMSSNNQPTNRSLVFEDKYSISRKNGNGDTNERNKFMSIKSSLPTSKESSKSLTNIENLIPRVTNMVKHFEEFKIGGEDERSLSRDHGRSNKEQRGRSNVDFDDFDIRQNFEEFNLDDCDLSDDPDRPEADGSERLSDSAIRQTGSDDKNSDNNNVIYTSSCLPNTNSSATNGIYDNFLEATGLSNKSILTPSRLLSNHKSMLKPKDVKYKNKIKANAVLEKNHSQTGSSHFTQVRHWTGPFV